MRPRCSNLGPSAVAGLVRADQVDLGNAAYTVVHAFYRLADIAVFCGLELRSLP